MNSKTIFRCVTLVLAGALCGAAFAADAPPATSVNFSDLNLKSPAGIAALYSRIEHAADQVCDLPRETRQIKSELDLKTCKARVTERTVLQVSIPELSALHLARTGQKETPVRLASEK